jgi:peptidylprolyl isomerase
MSVKQGDKVRVHYVGKLSDESVFDSSLERDPLEFTIGNEQVIRGFEDAVIGMEIGEQKIIEIPSGNAYGPYRHELVTVIDRSQLPVDMEPQIGRQLQVTGDTGEHYIMLITDITGTEITLDANHPLAGKDLTFELNLVDIV